MRLAAKYSTLLGLIVLCASCASLRGDSPPEPWGKVELDLTQLDAEGLRGSPGGKVSVSYEFTIPNTAQCKAAVSEIDRTVQFMPGSSGRIGAGKHECLCIGTTGKGHRDVLRRLAELPYVERITECHFE